MIEHILGNSMAYIEEYKKKENQMMKKKEFYQAYGQIQTVQLIN